MYTLKSIARRGSLLGAAGALVASTFLPALAYADTLNPLTERSLLLSSSASGYQNSDGAGNSAGAPNAIGENYAPAGSGPNGQKTGETFSFKVSTNSAGTGRPIKALTFQYCTTAAGVCQAPGDNTGDARGANTRETNAVAFPSKRSDLDVVGAFTAGSAAGQFQVFEGATDVTSGWTMSSSNVEDDAHSGALTGKNNFITLVNATGISPVNEEQIRVIFKASESNYITNPGSGAFFVKINTYDSDLTADHIPAVPAATNSHIIDGGVTVANVMTDSIHITTKVLETMAFSVGTRNRDTVQIAVNGQPGYEGPAAVHGTCDPIQAIAGNQLQLGNPDAEYSLETGKTWDVNSYWRLSSNSSGGATVYYSGNTLANTVGDEIAPIGATKAASTQGTEQFGLAFVDAGADTFDTAFTDLITAQPTRFRLPSLTSDSLAPGTNYADGTGKINPDGLETGTAAFAFEKESNTVPRVIATNNTNVISCATAKMRYIANIGADTPAGVYTTKINYLAAPQY